MPVAVGLIADAYNAPAAGGPGGVAGCSGWWDGSDTATITSSAGAVSQWDDKSGSTFHVTQATAGNKPTTGSTTINGRNVITFDGGDFLSRASTLLVGAASGEWSAFCVVRPSNVVGTRMIIASQGGGANTAQYLRNNGTGPETIAWNTGSPFTDAGPNITVSTATQYSAIRGATAVELWRDAATNGGLATTGIPAKTAGLLEVGGLGGAVFWQGDIAELIVYNVALGTTDRQTIQNYLKTKWGTP